jgi:hypothetical protein
MSALLGLGYWSSGLKQFSANKPLLGAEDANGLKFRVQTSDVAVAMIEAVGAFRPASLRSSEVYGALHDRCGRRAGKLLVEHLHPEVLRGAGRRHRNQPPASRLPSRDLDRLAQEP